jgi:putative MATE family efflux protein
MTKENGINLLEGNLYKTILKLGYPMAIASVVQMLYNLADAFWLGKLGREALAAPIISFNIIFFIISLGMGFSIAGTTLVSQYTGSGEKEKANKVAGNLLLYLIFFSVFFVFVGLFFDKVFLNFLATPEDTFDLTLSYYRVMVIGMPLAFPFFVYQSVMNGYGDTMSPLKIQIISAAINLILDPILIFGWFGFPCLGVKGAALTTIITRGIASFVGIYYFFSGTKGIKLNLKHLKPDFKLTPLIFKIGFPSSIGMSGASLGFLVLIGIVNKFGTPVISAYGIANRVVHLFMMPALGISSAVSAIVGQNLGANNLRRAKDAVKKGVYLILVVIVPSMILTALFGEYITIFFIPKDPLVHQIGTIMFYIVSPSVIFFALTSVFNSAFQGAGFTVPVMATNLARIWVFRIPLVYFFSFILLNGTKDINSSVGIWGGMFFSNLFAFLMILVWYLKGNWVKSRINIKSTSNE